MLSSISSLRSKSEGENGHSGGNLGLISTFSASSFMVGDAARLDMGRATADLDGEMNPVAVESCLSDSKARRLQRIVAGDLFSMIKYYER